MKAFIVIAIATTFLSGCAGISPIREAEQRASLHHQQGVNALREKDGAKAITELMSCLDIVPTHIRCHWELGWAHYLERNWIDAIVFWRSVKRMDPQFQGIDGAIARIEAQYRYIVAGEALRKRAPLTATKPHKKRSVRPTIKIRAVGDVMLGSDYPKNGLPPEGGPKPLEQIKSLLLGIPHADLVFANLEGSLCDRGKTEKCGDPQKSENQSKCYAFRTPTRFVEYLQNAGINLLSLANNHNADFGEECRIETENTLNQAGIMWSGRPGSFAEVERKRLKIAMVAFHSAPHCNHLNDTEQATQFVRSLAKKHPIVVVSFHGGAEGFEAIHVPDKAEVFYGENRGHLREFARQMIDSGASLVLGHGPHVPRGMEIYKNRLIAYSLGNFATYKGFNLWGFNGTGPILEVDLDRRGRFVGGKIIPIRQLGEGIPVEDTQRTAINLIRLLSEEDFPETGVIIAQDGTLKARKKR